jgi:hypothetical protein
VFTLDVELQYCVKNDAGDQKITDKTSDFLDLPITKVVYAAQYKAKGDQEQKREHVKQ